MTTRAAVDEPGAEGGTRMDVADAILGARAQALKIREFSLEQLPAAPHGARGIAQDDVSRRIRRRGISDASAYLLFE